MDAEVRPGTVSGIITPPASKSETHRALLATALAGGGTVHNPLDCRDTRATADAIEALGSGVEWTGDAAVVEGFPDGRPQPAAAPIDCANSGTTLRFVTAVAALGSGTTTLTGDASLCRRPNGPLLEALDVLGATAESDAGNGTAPLSVTGPLSGGSVAMPGGVSSQFVSGVLIAGVTAPNGIDIELTSALSSAPYLQLTISMLETYGIDITATNGRYRAPGGQQYSLPADEPVIGADPTASSYPLVAGAIASDTGITVTDVGRRGDEPAPIIGVLESLGVELSVNGRRVSVERTRPEPATVDLGSCPDLLPTVAVVAGLGDGTSHLVNCRHARYKETDRISVSAEAMRTLGVPVSDREDGLTVRGRPEGFVAGTVDPHGDHRIAMAASVAGLAADGPVRIRDADCVSVSYPSFFEDLSGLGADVNFSQ